MNKPFENMAENAIVNERSRQTRQRLTASNHSDPVEEDRAMTDCSQYGESTPEIKTYNEFRGVSV